MTLLTSHPHRWLFGGVLERQRWRLPDQAIPRWDQRIEHVRTGDEVLVLRTPVAAVFVGLNPMISDAIEAPEA